MNRMMKTAVVACWCMLAGCAGRHAVVSEPPKVDVEVFGLQLGSATDYRTLEGVTATEEPCLKGYERSFDALDLTVGYGFDKRIRRIATRHPDTSVYGIRPGMPAEEGRQSAVQAGLRATATPDRFQGDGYFVTLLVDESEKVFGIALEAKD